MKAAKGDREKQQIAKAVSGDILKKYRAIKHIKPFCSWKRYNSSMIRQKFGVYERRRRNIIEYEAVRFEVQQFLELDCNSKLCPGKKDCVTQGSVKKQKRFLTDTMENLHRKFLEETERFHTLHSARCILSGYFSQGLRTDKHVCIRRDNMQFLVDKLNFLGITKPANITQLCNSVCCNANHKVCAYGECKQCEEKKMSE